MRLCQCGGARWGTCSSDWGYNHLDRMSRRLEKSSFIKMVSIKTITGKINAGLLPMKGHYFFWNAGTAPIVSFISTFARQLGFSSVVVGTIYTILPVCGLLAKPLFGILADRLQWQKGLFLAFQVVTIVAYFGVQFVPEVPTQTTVVLDCGASVSFKICTSKVTQQCNTDLIAENTATFCKLSCSTANNSLAEEVCSSWNTTEQCPRHINSVTETSTREQINTVFSEAYCELAAKDIQFVAKIPWENIHKENSCLQFNISTSYFGDICTVPYCNSVTSAPCSIHCNSSALGEVLESAATTTNDTLSLYQFWLLFFQLVLSWVGMTVVVSVGDTICFYILGEKHMLYGRQRLWGSIGWGIFSFVTGVLIDEFSRGKQKKDYTPMFYVLLIMVGLDFCVSFRLKYAQQQQSENIVRDVAKLLLDIRIIMFILWTIASGVCTGLLWQFLFWHLEDLALLKGCEAQQWIKTLQGGATAIQCFGGELPFLFISGNLLTKIGHTNAMSIVLAAYGVRFLLYSFLSDPWWCLPIELLHGPTYGLLYATIVSYASIVAPPGTETTVQGLAGAIFEGIGASLGSLLGGILYQQGGAFTFRVYGIGSLIVLCVHMSVHWILARRPQYGVQPADIAAKSRPD